LRRALGPDGIFQRLERQAQEIEAINKRIEIIPRDLQTELNNCQTDYNAIEDEKGPKRWFGHQDRLDNAYELLRKAKDAKNNEPKRLEEEYAKLHEAEELADRLQEEVRALPGNPGNKDQAVAILEQLNGRISGNNS